MGPQWPCHGVERALTVRNGPVTVTQMVSNLEGGLCTRHALFHLGLRVLETRVGVFLIVCLFSERESALFCGRCFPQLRPGSLPSTPALDRGSEVYAVPWDTAGGGRGGSRPARYLRRRREGARRRCQLRAGRVGAGSAGLGRAGRAGAV